ncbi:MAG: hypothetical protein LBL90_06310 [Prevotellaceae bacterium]|jgi:sialate O-acetylesterase|nr:hypothetical protein [Prevotellaceae bacterium]
MLKRYSVILLIVAFVACSQKPQVFNSLSLAHVFTENMVLQRNKTNKIWGRATPFAKVFMELDNRKYQAKTDDNGDWCIEIDTLKAGGPYSLLCICGNDSLSLQNIWVGDIWLCSGQSNMEFSVGNFLWCEEEVKIAGNEQIFFYTLPNTMDLVPVSKIPQASWYPATGDALRALSATAYFFAKNIQPKIGVPVGLIVSDWSGTAIEPWMSKEAIALFSQYSEALVELNANTLSREKVNAAFAELRENGWDADYYLKGAGMEEKWYLPETDFSDWKSIKFPNYWEDANVGLDNFDGAVWFKTSFDLPENFKLDSFQIFLDYVKDYNIAWINGQQIGETFGSKNWSNYYASAKYLKAKDNILVVRVFNVEGKGGFNYHPLWESEILAGNWVFRPDYAIDSEEFLKPMIFDKNPFSDPTVLYNAMIYPLLNYSLTGFVWYQGESNVGRGYEYRHIFPTMITDWRKQFNQGDLPFYYVQLANFGTSATQPQDSDWAELRESQTAALQLPNTGMAVAIDIGESHDIHPQNKQEIGRRLALLALDKTYGESIESESPHFNNVLFERGKAVIFIGSATFIKKCDDSKSIRAFALAGADSIFHWAEYVEIKDNRIIVSSSKVSNPVAVRYAWSKNPGELNICNSARLPLAPFRSDDWEGITTHRVYDMNIVYF